MANSKGYPDTLLVVPCTIVILSIIFDFIVGTNSLILVSNTERTSEDVNDILGNIATKNIAESIVLFSAISCLVGVSACYCKDYYDSSE